MSGPPEIHAFSVPKVRLLTGLSSRRLQYWDEQGLISPSVSSGAGKGRPRLYDFADLVSLRVAADLRRQGISLQLAADGLTITDVLEMYPDLQPGDVEAALAVERPRRTAHAG